MLGQVRKYWPYDTMSIHHVPYDMAASAFRRTAISLLCVRSVEMERKASYKKQHLLRYGW